MVGARDAGGPGVQGRARGVQGEVSDRNIMESKPPGHGQHSIEQPANDHEDQSAHHSRDREGHCEVVRSGVEDTDGRNQHSRGAKARQNPRQDAQPGVGDGASTGSWDGTTHTTSMAEGGRPDKSM